MNETISAIWAKAAEFDPEADYELEEKYVAQQRAVLGRLIDAYLDAGDEFRADLVRRMLAFCDDGHFWTARYDDEDPKYPKLVPGWRGYGVHPTNPKRVPGETLEQLFERYVLLEREQ